MCHCQTKNEKQYYKFTGLILLLLLTIERQHFSCSFIDTLEISDLTLTLFHNQLHINIRIKIIIV